MDEPRPILIPAPGWSNAYVSPPVPFIEGGRNLAGWDCWGLVCWIFAEQLGIALASHEESYAGVADHASIAEVFDHEREAWHELEPREAPQGFDVAWMAIAGVECHVALFVDPTTAIHVLDGTGTRTIRMGSPLWRARIRARFRHRATL